MWITQSSCSEPQAATETVAKSLFLIKSSDSSNTPANTTSYISSNGQIAIPNLRITTASRAEWFSVTVPASTTGTMVVTDQSANLSMLSPSLWLYKPGPKPPIAIGSASSTAYGATVSYSLAGVQAGQTSLLMYILSTLLGS